MEIDESLHAERTHLENLRWEGTRITPLDHVEDGLWLHAANADKDRMIVLINEEIKIKGEGREGGGVDTQAYMSR